MFVVLRLFLLLYATVNVCYLGSFQVVTLDFFLLLKFAYSVPVFTLNLFQIFCQFLEFLYKPKNQLQMNKYTLNTVFYKCLLLWCKIILWLRLSSFISTSIFVSRAFVAEDASSNSFWSFWLVSSELLCCRYNSLFRFVHSPWCKRKYKSKQNVIILKS